MKHVLSSALLAALALVAVPSSTVAQTSVPIPYQLGDGSAYIVGCFPPCFCPILANPWLSGGFTMQYTFTDSLGADHYAVQSVDLFLGIGSPDHITGQGEYVFLMFGTPFEQLQLDLSVNGGAPQHFDSGLVGATATFPDIDISIGMNGFNCQDTVYRIVASIGTPGVPFCSGDGTATACPCGNAGGSGRGCANSIFSSGSLLGAVGAASISLDTVHLVSSDTPDSTCLFYQGTSQQAGGAGNAFGDGLRCAGGLVTRLRPVVAVNGEASIPLAGGPSLSAIGGITAPGTYTYQVWYRNAASFCTSSTFNLSNGLELTWIP